MSTWAARLNATPGLPTPMERLRALADFYATLSAKTVLEEALGKNKTMLSMTPKIACPLVEHTIIVCVDTESHTLNTDQMTELGITYISRKTAREVGAPGSHGWRLQEALKFLHFRVVEHAHLKSNREDSLGPLGNRFGHTRFSTFAELRIILNHLFNQEIKTDHPELKGCTCPIVLVGHALKHDTENTNKKGLEYNIEQNLTVVAKVDTQALAREAGVWHPPPNMHTNEIGLRTLIETLEFQHLDDHTACNDAARTMMCAIHMVLPDSLRGSDNPSMQAVADRVEARSKTTSPAPYGTKECCIRCSGRDHSDADCPATVKCAACDRFDVGTNRQEHIASHIETYCPHVARFKAWARRYRDAAAKRRALTAEVAAGPGDDAHPWSTWPRQVKWPLQDLKDVLVGFNLVRHNERFHEPPAVVNNLQSALGGLFVPSAGGRVATGSASSGMMKATISSSLPSTNVGALSAAYPPLPPTSGGATTQPPAFTAPTQARTAAAPARKVTTMSEQRERARRAAEEQKRGWRGSAAGHGGLPGGSGSGAAGGGIHGGASAGTSWW